MKNIQTKPFLLTLAGLLAIMPSVVLGKGIIVVKDHLEVEHFGSTTYINGGVGEAEETLMKRLENNFPLKIIFSAGQTGQYIVDVPVFISDMNGKHVFDLAKSGPLLDVILSDGRYKVTAQFNGETQVRDVTLKNARSETLYFNWKDHP